MLHAGGRRKGKARSRILYWFRTPPGVRVGRAALDEDAIRLIEEYNPDVEFDWPRILKGQAVEPKPASAREQDPRAEKAGRRREDRPVVPLPPPIAPPSTVVVEAPAEEPAPEPEPRPVDARLGPEGLLRLRARYAEVLARISERIQDSFRQEELKTQAERLNPDTWVTDAEVSAGLDAYESVYESLRSVVGGQSRHRRRRRRRGGGQQAQPSSSHDDQRPDALEDEPPAEEDDTEDL